MNYSFIFLSLFSFFGMPQDQGYVPDDHNQIVTEAARSVIDFEATGIAKIKNIEISERSEVFGAYETSFRIVVLPIGELVYFERGDDRETVTITTRAKTKRPSYDYLNSTPQWSNTLISDKGLEIWGSVLTKRYGSKWKVEDIRIRGCENLGESQMNKESTSALARFTREDLGTNLRKLDARCLERSKLCEQLLEKTKALSTNHLEEFENLEFAIKETASLKTTNDLSIKDFATSQEILIQAVSNWLRVIEQYPNYKSSSWFVMWLDEYARSANTIFYEIENYNDIAKQLSAETYPIKKRDSPAPIIKF